jgi:hypothetical protein
VEGERTVFGIDVEVGIVLFQAPHRPFENRRRIERSPQSGSQQMGAVIPRISGVDHSAACRAIGFGTLARSRRRQIVIPGKKGGEIGALSKAVASLSPRTLARSGLLDLLGYVRIALEGGVSRRSSRMSERGPIAEVQRCGFRAARVIL